MANNRMGIRCRRCGEVLWFAKTFLDGYYVRDKDIYNTLNNFFEEHTFCMKDINEENKIDLIAEPEFDKENVENVDEENVFEIVYEFWNEGDE